MVTLPTLKPGEVGLRWFGITDENFNGGANTSGLVKIKAMTGDPEVSNTFVEVKIGGVSVKMRMVKLTRETIDKDSLVGAVRDSSGRLIIDYWECDQ